MCICMEVSEYFLSISSSEKNSSETPWKKRGVYDTIRATTGRPRDLAGRVFSHIRDRASYFRQIRDDLHQAYIPL